MPCCEPISLFGSPVASHRCETEVGRTVFNRSQWVSSTVGLWVLRSAATYPEVMRQELVGLRPNAEIKVVNSGRIGDTIEGNVARFKRDLFSHRPDLVVWQLGTDDVAWGGHPDAQLRNRVLQGVQMLKASGADIILMDLQYAPRCLLLLTIRTWRRSFPRWRGKRKSDYLPGLR